MVKTVGIYILGIVSFFLLPWWAILGYFFVVIFFTRNDLFVLLLAISNDLIFAPLDQFSIGYFKNIIIVLLFLGIKFLLQKFTRINFVYDQKN